MEQKRDGSKKQYRKIGSDSQQKKAENPDSYSEQDCDPLYSHEKKKDQKKGLIWMEEFAILVNGLLYPSEQRHKSATKTPGHEDGPLLMPSLCLRVFVAKSGSCLIRDP